MGCAPRQSGTQREITFVLFVYWKRTRNESRARLYAPPSRSRKVCCFWAFWKVPVEVRRPGSGCVSDWSVLRPHRF